VQPLPAKVIGVGGVEGTVDEGKHPPEVGQILISVPDIILKEPVPGLPMLPMSLPWD